MPDLYTIGNNTDIANFLNNTLSNVCMNVDVPSSCGAFIFFDVILGVAWLLLFSYFSQRNSFKDSYAGASTIVAFFSIVLYLAPGYNFVRDIELLFILANMFLSIIALYMLKE